ncbi:o-succinylbenzoate synthase [Sporotomaculum syntrophicum]|uniref:o-succinylbenzoate synthase n=1 Tax=Sporotomaculum syntrophicum TaxID=182264 RepID=A0A9D2WN31_9FIRM|nr:o-succinylbenzoate synthase [Sporotomaculum syntrophicum]KAF1084233.1 o-succinylbenzoate synthase [Sporotomaculum syntrophicum]
MWIKSIELFHLSMPLKFTFKTSQTSLNRRETLVIKLMDDLGNTGHGEVVAFNEPFYTKETLSVAKRKLINRLLPRLLRQEIKQPFEVHQWMDLTHPMATAGLENAVLDLFARRQRQSIMDLVFHEETSDKIYAGIVLGDLDSQSLLNQIEEYVNEGYVRFKIKIKPEDGYAKLKQIRAKYPDLMLLADANNSFTLEQMRDLKEIDELGLLCLEEPMTYGDFSAYQKLQAQMKTPLCLDESIQFIEDLNTAIALKACQVVNIKVGRVGGLYYAKQMIDLCRRHNIHYWVGSMMESGISKILHVHLASLKDNYIPGDLSSSRRYFAKDVIQPEITVQHGLILVPKGPGLGVEIDEAALKYFTIDHTIIDGRT